MSKNQPHEIDCIEIASKLADIEMASTVGDRILRFEATGVLLDFLRYMQTYAEDADMAFATMTLRAIFFGKNICASDIIEDLVTTPDSKVIVIRSCEQIPKVKASELARELYLKSANDSIIVFCYERDCYKPIFTKFSNFLS